jgi:alkylhydroperoxidase family enzyme
MPRLRMLGKDEIPVDYLDVFGAGLNIHRLTLHSPTLARLSRQMGLYFRTGSKLDPRLRELATVQVARIAQSDYEYSHHLKMAEEAGAPASELQALASGRLDLITDPVARGVLRVATSLASGAGLSDEDFSAIADLPSDQIVDLLFLITFYCGFVRFTGALQTPVESDYVRFLNAYPMRDEGGRTNEGAPAREEPGPP